VQSVLLSAHRSDACDNACKAFLALSDLLEFVHLSNRSGISDATIAAAVHKFLSLFVAAWGETKLIPKCHWLLHFAKQYATHGMLLSCFVNERYHRIAKRYANDATNTSNDASRNLLKEVVCHVLQKVSEPSAFDFNVGLVDGRVTSVAARKRVLSFLGLDDDDVDDGICVRVGAESRFSLFGTCFKDDVVLVDIDGVMHAGKVILHAEIGDEPWSVIEPWAAKSFDPSSGYAEWNVGDERIVLETKCILDAVVYTKLADGIAAESLIKKQMNKNKSIRYPDHDCVSIAQNRPLKAYFVNN
jgi:hypothetical protein